MTTRKEYEAWAKHAVHKTVGDLLWACWEKSASLERESCARICDLQTKEPECPERAAYCAEAIRRRSNNQVKADAEGGRALNAGLDDD